MLHGEFARASRAGSLMKPVDVNASGGARPQFSEKYKIFTVVKLSTELPPEQLALGADPSCAKLESDPFKHARHLCVSPRVRIRMIFTNLKEPQQYEPSKRANLLVIGYISRAALPLRRVALL